MKTFIRKSAVAVAFILALAASSFPVNAQENNLIFDKSATPAILINVLNGIGETILIKNSKGNIVYEGKITSEKTLYIPTTKLGTGTFYVYIGKLQMKTFNLLD